MKIPRMSMITIGVADLAKATAFYAQVLATSPNTDNPGVTFIQLPGVWLGLYPLAELAKDISPTLDPARSGFNGVTLGHNARSRAEVTAIIDRARQAGATVVKEAEDTFWGGFSGYFADLDGQHWEIAWGPMFDFDAHGDMFVKAEPAESVESAV